MKSTAKRSFAAALASLMMLTLAAGCKNDDDGEAAVTKEGTDGTAIGQTDYVYTAKSVPFPQDVEGIYAVAYHDGRVYFSGMTVEGNPDDDYEKSLITNTFSEIYSMNIDGSGFTRLTGYKPAIPRKDGVSSTAFVSKMTVDEDGFIWVVEEWDYYTFNLPSGFDAKNFDQNIAGELSRYQEYLDSGKLIRKLDTDGNELSSNDVTALQGDYEFFFVMAFDVCKSAGGADNILIGIGDYEAPGQTVYVLDSGGEIQMQLQTEHQFSRFIEMPDGTIAMPPSRYSAGTGGIGALPTIDLSAKAAGETIEIPSLGGQLDYHSGKSAIRTDRGADGDASSETEGYDLLIGDNVSLYGYTLGDDAVKLLEWLDCNVVVGSIENIYMMPDGRIVCINNLWSGNAGIVVLTKTHVSELPDKTVITLAGWNINQSIKNAVAEFNKESLDYRVEVTDYIDFDTSDPGAGLTRLITEISSGTVPDILDVSLLGDKNYERKGLFADLYPYIDADPELDRSFFVQPVLRAVERDGKLYQAFSGFYVSAIIGSPQILGSGQGWDLDEFMAVLDENPGAIFPMGHSMSKADFFRKLLRRNADEFIDWDTGKVSFESDEFIKILEVCNRFPADADYTGIEDDLEAVAAGHQIMSDSLITSFNDVQAYRAYGMVWQDGEYVYKGYPSADKNGLSVAPTGSLAIIESSPNKDAAWSFVRTILNPDWQSNDNTYLYGFPSAQAALDRVYENTLEGKYSYSLGITNPDGSFRMVELDAPEPEDVDIIVNLINSVTMGSNLRIIDDALFDIILGIASDYFDGTRSAGEVAHDIQNRAAIYVAEQS